MKKKLDLNNLLAKYDGGSSYYGSPNKNKADYIDEEFYQYPQYSKSYQDPHPLPERVVSTQVRNVSGHFSMSKSQVEAFLLSLREDIRNEERIVNRQVETSLRVLLDNFQKEHEKLKRELIDMMDRSFIENERLIRDELSRLSKTESPEFGGVYRKISSLDQEIDRLLSGLKGAEYRQSIAEVVTRDFQIEIQDLRGLTATASSSYLQSLGEIVYDRARVETIRENLQRLFYINRRSSSPPPRPASTHIHEVSRGIFSTVKERDRSQLPVAQSRTRKSWFNFGAD